jgi:predicted metal-binding membrane protein
MDFLATFQIPFKRDRIFILSTLLLVTFLAWVYLFREAWNMQHVGEGLAKCCIPKFHAWNLADFWIVFVMWAIMMVGMMLPTVIPMALTFAMVNRKRKEQENPFVPTWIFLSGYLIVWTLFSALATGLQWVLHNKALVSPTMVSASPILNGILLILAGVFQLTPLKNTCLAHCRTPLSFIMTDWQEGKRGALMMGLRHGFFCTGCCWILMMLLFVLGVMNLWWIAIISIFVLLEKIMPRAVRLSLISGALLMGWGIMLLAGVFPG